MNCKLVSRLRPKSIKKKKKKKNLSKESYQITPELTQGMDPLCHGLVKHTAIDQAHKDHMALR
jgi:hypothetical protein